MGGAVANPFGAKAPFGSTPSNPAFGAQGVGTALASLSQQNRCIGRSTTLRGGGGDGAVVEVWDGRRRLEGQNQGARRAHFCPHFPSVEPDTCIRSRPQPPRSWLHARAANPTDPPHGSGVSMHRSVERWAMGPPVGRSVAQVSGVLQINEIVLLHGTPLTRHLQPIRNQ